MPVAPLLPAEAPRAIKKEEKEVKAYHKLRIAQSDARLVGIR